MRLDGFMITTCRVDRKLEVRSFQQLAEDVLERQVEVFHERLAVGAELLQGLAEVRYESVLVMEMLRFRAC